MALTAEMDTETESADRGDNSTNSRYYKSRKQFRSRREEGEAIRKEFPNHVPIIAERYAKDHELPKIVKRFKFLVPQETSVSQFVAIIRNRLKVDANQSLFILVNKHTMLTMSKTLSEVYNEHKSDDSFLYMTYASQDVFG